MKPGSVSANIDPLYQDFEPYCEWKRGEDLLIVHIPDFKKEHLKMKVNSSGVLKISGERPLQESRDHQATRIISKQRFYKETRVPEGCNIEDIHAKICNGILTINFPRQSPITIYNPPLAEPPRQDQTMSMQEKKAATIKISGGGGGGLREPDCSVLENVLGKCGIEYKDDDDKVGFGRFKVAKKIVVGVGVAVVAMAAIGALVVFKTTSNSSSSSSSSSRSSSSSDSLVRAEE